ncbi:M15 family metallopeptidase [Kitasatospora sp. SUK 42]|uniref:M15 family metallopeptidase n=1 Tax=Kitasatospora sp. SUK 42 TaxID=1588882 RepID=UPI0018CBD4CE|nr:M15 family metallopeptidase [Kitasatospora sp. SUK 42]MBV2152079.1 M15 family metallopeptidase [Kitasatospora sp. SUK 42]
MSWAGTRCVGRVGRRVAAGVSGAAVLVWAAACAADRPAAESALRTLAETVSAAPSPSVTGGADDDGEIPDGVTLSPFDDRAAAVRNLDGPLLEAVRKAATDAKAQGIEMTVTSGWRNKEYQQRLLDRGVVKYGSLEQARRFVNTPEKSAHVSGKAIDLGPTSADYWLIQHGAKYGLCQVYANEIWHFELRTTPGGTCPALLPDAAG